MSKARDLADIASDDVIATTATGVDVTGTVTADGLTVDTGSTFALSATFGHTGGSQLFLINDDNGTRNQIDSQKNSASADLDLATGGTKRIKVASNGDVSFYEDTGTTPKFYWDSSAESLGIGTTSLSTNSIIKEVHIDSPYTNGLSRLRLSSSVENLEAVVGLNGYLGEDALYFAIGSSGDGSATERMRIDSSGNVGINETNPSGFASQVVSTVGTTKGAFSARSTGGAGVKTGFIFNNGNYGFLDYDPTTTNGVRLSAINNLRFGINSNAAYGSSTFAEAMRIDSSGNVLVGTTNANPVTSNTAGISLGSDKIYRATVVSGPAMALNRSTTDGSIVELRKDGSTVGSIGSFNGDTVMGTGLSAVRFNDGGASITPHRMDTNGTHDASTDLGQSNYRFKDLYLSGGVYLGGTQFTSRRSETGGGSLIFATVVSGKAQMGELYAYDTATSNWCQYSLKKNDQNANVTIQQISGSGLTVAATNAQGTMQMSVTASTVKMVVTIWVVEN